MRCAVDGSTGDDRGGKTAAGRAGTSILANVGLSEFAARDGEQFVQIAASLAADSPRLAELHRPAAAHHAIAGHGQAEIRSRHRSGVSPDVAGSGNPKSEIRMTNQIRNPNGEKGFGAMIHQRLESAAEHHRAGRLGEAEALSRQIIADRPDCADALHLMGVLALQAGRRESRRSHQPGDQPATVRRRLPPESRGRFFGGREIDRSRQLLPAGLELRPGFAEAHAGLGQAFLQIGDRGQSVHHLRQAAELAPESVDIIRALPTLFCGRVKWTRPSLNIAGSCCAGLGMRWRGQQFRSALRRKKQWGDAQAALRQALTLQPDLSVAFENLAAVLCAAGRYDESIAVCRRRLSLQAESAAILDTYGGALHATNRIDQAIEQYRRAVAVDPRISGLERPWPGVGGRGLNRRSAAVLRPGAGAESDFSDCAHDRLNLMFFHPAIDAAAIVAEHRSWNQRFAAPLMPANPAFENDRSPDRRLRIGYCSPNFFRQVQSLLTLPLFFKSRSSPF